MPATDRQHHQVPPVQPTNRGRTQRTTKARQVNWNEWWPFERATGEALKQLNKRQPKEIIEYEDALL